MSVAQGKGLTPYKGMNAGGLLGGAAAGFALNGAAFTAATNYFTKSGTGMGAASDDMMVSCWIRRTTTGAEECYQSDPGGRWNLIFDSSNRLLCSWANTAGGNSLLSRAATTYTDTNWHHVMFACHNETSTGGAATMEVYVDGADETNILTNTIGTDQFEPQGETHNIGAGFTGDMSQLWVDDSNYDLTNASVRQAFYNAGAVDLGADGSNPGTTPFLYLLFAPGNLAVNSGSAGDLTEVGTVTNSATSPTD